MSRAAKCFWAIVAAQVLLLLAWAGYHEFVRQHAPLLVLKGRPVDPQDLLRGDFLTLNYDISSVTLAGAKPSEADAGRDVWVLLEPRGRYHVVVQASREPLTPNPGQVLVRGTLGYDWRNAAGTSHVDYGIERYFVPEGKGAPRFNLMEIEVAVSPAHRLYIKRVLLDGRAYP
jgi:uncharacterized membrane-anchored protein